MTVTCTSANAVGETYSQWGVNLTGAIGTSGYSGYSGSGVSGYSGYSCAPLATAGVATSPIASQTDQITHGLGIAPLIIRLTGVSNFTSNNSSTATTFSKGTWSSSGNRCIYQPYGGAITTTAASAVSSVFSIILYTAAGIFISGVVQNVTSTTFDIVWTETGISIARNYMWECQ